MDLIPPKQFKVGVEGKFFNGLRQGRGSIRKSTTSPSKIIIGDDDADSPLFPRGIDVLGRSSAGFSLVGNTYIFK